MMVSSHATTVVSSLALVLALYAAFMKKDAVGPSVDASEFVTQSDLEIVREEVRAAQKSIEQSSVPDNEDEVIWPPVGDFVLVDLDIEELKQRLASRGGGRFQWPYRYEAIKVDGEFVKHGWYQGRTNEQASSGYFMNGSKFGYWEEFKRHEDSRDSDSPPFRFNGWYWDSEVVTEAEFNERLNALAPTPRLAHP